MASNPALTQVNTRDVVYTIEHVAALFHVKVDSAREYTYRQDFPPAHQLGARLLWDRDEVLSWFRFLPRLTLADSRRGESVVAEPSQSLHERASRVGTEVEGAEAGFGQGRVEPAVLTSSEVGRVVLDPVHTRQRLLSRPNKGRKFTGQDVRAHVRISCVWA
jgi:hypothetical protein